MAHLGGFRRNFGRFYTNAGSNIDVCVPLNSVADLLRYLPRGIMNGFLAPYPSMWLSAGVAVLAGRVVLPLWRNLRHQLRVTDRVGRAPGRPGQSPGQPAQPDKGRQQRRGAGVQREPEVGRVEVDRGLHICDEVANAGVLVGRGHGGLDDLGRRRRLRGRLTTGTSGTQPFRRNARRNGYCAAGSGTRSGNEAR